MAASSRATKEYLIEQGVYESIRWRFDFTPYTSLGSITSGTAYAYNTTDGARVDVSGTVLSGVTSVAHPYVTCPPLSPGTQFVDQRLRLYCRVTDGTQVMDAYTDVLVRW